MILIIWAYEYLETLTSKISLKLRKWPLFCSKFLSKKVKICQIRVYILSPDRFTWSIFDVKVSLDASDPGATLLILTAKYFTSANFSGEPLRRF